jgi:hypothetical protein
MSDSDRSKKTPVPTESGDKAAGRIVHDARGNAVWDWVAETGRILIDSTSRLLRRLEVPDLKVEEQGEPELRLESDRDPGGGYDPYGRSGSGKKGAGGARSGSTPDQQGGGYDPYSKDAARKPKGKL